MRERAPSRNRVGTRLHGHHLDIHVFKLQRSKKNTHVNMYQHHIDPGTLQYPSIATLWDHQQSGRSIQVIRWLACPFPALTTPRVPPLFHSSPAPRRLPHPHRRPPALCVLAATGYGPWATSPTLTTRVSRLLGVRPGRFDGRWGCGRCATGHGWLFFLSASLSWPASCFCFPLAVARPSLMRDLPVLAGIWLGPDPGVRRRRSRFLWPCGL